LGDLSTSLAYETFDMSGMKIVAPKKYPEKISADENLLDKPTYRQAIKDGYAIFPTNDKIGERLKYGPIRWLSGNSDAVTEPIYGKNPIFYLADRSSGSLKFIINNGQLFNLEDL
jgi:hypothetical protein